MIRRRCTHFYDLVFDFSFEFNVKFCVFIFQRLIVKIFKILNTVLLRTGTSPTRRSDIVLNVHDMRDVPDSTGTYSSSYVQYVQYVQGHPACRVHKVLCRYLLFFDLLSQYLRTVHNNYLIHNKY